MNGPEPAADGRARVRVVRGAPDDVELAALVAGLVAASARSDDSDESTPHSMWHDRARGMRGSSVRTAPGPDAWRWSLRD